MVVSHGGDFVESLTPPMECFVYNFLQAIPYNDELNTFTAMTATDDHIFLHKPDAVVNLMKEIPTELILIIKIHTANGQFTM